MLKRSKFWLIATAVVFMAVIFLSPALPAHAGGVPATNTSSDSCQTCHEQLYFLHDSGDWYCISEHQNHCANCHAGDDTALTEAEAHLGTIAHPQQDSAAKCIECHTQEYADAYLVKFAAVKGFEEVILPEPYVPGSQLKTGYPSVEEAHPVLDNLPWLAFAFVLFGLWLFLALRS